MTTKQEPKYGINEQGRLFNRATGEEIPDDEPVFIIRAKDTHAFQALVQYANLCRDMQHSQIVFERARQFKEWREAHPERMHEPTSPD